MGLKKCFSIAIAWLLILCTAVPACAAPSEVIGLGRIGVTMPEIVVEIQGSGYDAADIAATLSSDKLLIEDVAKYDATSHTSCAYLLVDLSTSMRDHIDFVKKSIVSYINGLSSNDRVVLFTFGKTEVKTVLTGSETREEAVRIVNDLKCNEEGTLFYEALSRAYQLSNASNRVYDREYVMAFSDGIDLQKGSSTFEEVLKQYDSHALPLYAICMPDASKEAADKFGELSRVSGGYFSMIDKTEEFNDVLAIINDVTLVKMRASSNYADGSEKQLSIRVDSSQIECLIPVVRSIADMEAPSVTRLDYDTEKDVFVVAFSEKVVGAGVNSAYSITDAKGKTIEISAVFYSENEDAYEIKTASPVYKGIYTFEFSGIKDDSREANALTEKRSVEVEHSKNREEMPIWVLLLVAFGVLVVGLIVAVVCIFASKNRSGNEKSDEMITIPVAAGSRSVEEIEAVQEVVKYHIKSQEAVRIRLRIKTGRISEQNIETSIVSSLIVGRSDTCDIYIDDTKLSRQHFVIENDDGVFYVMDLQSRNGTMLNGIRINSRQRLFSGDKILAGLSDIMITILGG